MAPPALYQPPDGGWGWVVIGAAFVSIGFSYALPKAITVFFKEIQFVFNTSYSDVAWISSIMLAVMYAGGPISSILVNNFGSRPVVMLGGLLCCFGFITASFSKSILHLYITVGFIGGIGLAFNLQPALAIIGRYFYKKRPLANGLAMAGSPVILSTLAPLSQYLLNNYGWKGSFLILGGLLLNTCVAGSLMRPLDHDEVSLSAKNKIKVKNKQGNVKSRHPKTSISESMNNCLDFSLFKHRGFLIYLSGNVIMFLGFFAPILFLTLYAKDKGIDEYSAAFLLSVLAFVDMFARPSAGLIANTKYIRPRIQYFFGFAVMFTGLCHLLFPLAQTYISMLVYAVFFGLGFGSVSSVLFETLIDLVGAPRYSSAVGLVTIVECCPVLLGPPLAGKLVDYTRSYTYMYITCGVIVVIASVWLLIGNAINYRLLKQEKELTPSKKKFNNHETNLSDSLKDAKTKKTGIIPSEKETDI